ncbi:MAG: hypothetical protein ACYC4L_09845 [Chloroflexota bacterium]
MARERDAGRPELPLRVAPAAERVEEERPVVVVERAEPRRPGALG